MYGYHWEGKTYAYISIECTGELVCVCMLHLYLRPTDKHQNIDIPIQWKSMSSCEPPPPPPNSFFSYMSFHFDSWNFLASSENYSYGFLLDY